jgi:TRAP-type uncharacterized transport system substrate-binding protein
MNFIELFKEQFYFIGCDITREIRNHREVKIVTFPKEVLKKVVEQANYYNTNNISLNVSSWIDEYNAYALHSKYNINGLDFAFELNIVYNIY